MPKLGQKMPPPWPEPVKKFVHQEYNVKARTMKEVIAALAVKFPEVKNRITRDRIHALATNEAKKFGGKTQRKKKGTRKSVKPSVEVLPPEHQAVHQFHASQQSTAIARPMIFQLRTAPAEVKENVLARAREYRDQGFRFSAISERLQEEFKNVKIPPAGPLGRMVSDGTKKTTQKKQFKLSLRGPGIAWDMEVDKNIVRKLVSLLLGD